MKEFLKNTWKYLFLLIIGIIIGVCINIPSCSNTPKPEVVYIEKWDTIKIDSVRIKWRERPVEIYKIDTFYIKQPGDTVKILDLPITKKVYEDTIKTDSTSTEIKINYSGFNASVDNIYLKHNYYSSQKTIIKEPKKVGVVWFVGIYAGYGVHGSMNTGTFGHGPEIGIGVGLGLGNRIK